MNKKTYLASGFITLSAFGIAVAGECMFQRPEVSPDSWWYQEIPANVTLHANTANFKAYFQNEISTYFGYVNLNISSFSPPVFTVTSNTPLTNVVESDCFHTGYYDSNLAAQFTGVPIPREAVTANGGATTSDNEVTFYQPSTNTIWELWAALNVNGSWSSCWGGKKTQINTWDGRFGLYGQTASGIPISLGQIGVEEARRGDIRHVIGISLVRNKAGEFWWPAARTDGISSNANAIPEGARFRIDPTVNIDALNLHPYARAVAKAGQKYGFVVWDTAGSVGMRAENTLAYYQEGYYNPYTAAVNGTTYSGYGLWGATTVDHIFDRFPWNNMQFLPKDYGKPGVIPPVITPTTWTPNDISANLTAWFDASVSASYVSSGGSISKWCDPRDTAPTCTHRYASQATSGQQPTISGGVVTFTSGSSQLMSLSSPITGASTYTCWAAIQLPVSGGRAELFGNSTSNFFNVTLKDTTIHVKSVNGDNYAYPGWPDLTGFHTLMISSNNGAGNSGFEVRVDGAVQTVNGYVPSASAVSTWDVMGWAFGNVYPDLKIKEMFCSSAYESSDTKNNGHLYLRQKYSTP